MKGLNKRISSYFLALVMIFAMMPTSLVLALGEQTTHLIINQVYGGGGKGDNPISHSFIELYNPTEADINLQGYKVSYSSNRGGTNLGNTDGQEKELILNSVTLQAKTSYLIIGAVENTTPSVYGIANMNFASQEITTPGIYELGTADQEWPGRNIDNKQYAVKLIKDGVTVDAVTAVEKTGVVEDLSEGDSVKGISKQFAVRRKSFQDTGDNATDFEAISYENGNSEFVATNRPRSLKDGLWTQGTVVIPPVEANPVDKVAGYYNGTAALKMELIARYDTRTPNTDGGVAEIVKYNPDNQKFYVVNGQTKKLDIISIAELKSDSEKASVITRGQSINIEDVVKKEDNTFVYGDLTSISVNTAQGIIAVSVQAAAANDDGYVVILNYDGVLQKLISVGKQPDMLTFTPDNNYILVANEGEPRDGYTAGTDPMGSVTVISLKDGIETATGVNITFEAFDAKRQELIDNKVILKKSTNPSVDLEPEYIVANAGSTKAYVSLQEANAIATLDIASGEFTAIKGLGFKDYSKLGNELDLIKDTKIEIKNQDVLGAYMPDGLSIYEKDGKTYILTPNEGDSREWPGYKNLESTVIEGQKVDRLIAAEHDGLDEGKTYIIGGRSFSIWDAADMSLVYDSGSDFEKKTADLLPDYFNCSNSNTTLDSRSGKKGPEPEDIKVAAIDGKVYAYIGLERVGGIMLYDITNPKAAKFVNYINSRDFSASIAGDVSPEGLCPVSAANSPTGNELLLAANEVSGTVSVFEITKGTDQVILNDNKISIVSDTHLYSSELGTAGTAFEEYINNDRKMIAESEKILDAALEKIKADDSKVVLISGDLTKDGEKINHELMAQKLKELEDMGKKVFVINGNHDISNAAAYEYAGDTKTRVATVSVEDFKEIYKDFGYGEAIAKEADTLSYVVDLTPEYRLIVIDTCIYNNDISDPSSETEGRIKESTLAWVKEQIKAAKAANKQVVGMLHHGIVPHTGIQPQFFPEYLIKNYKQVGDELADAGLSAVFTGHFHSQDISSATSETGNKIYDVETGSLVTYPLPIRRVEISNKSLTITSEKISSVPGVDLKGKKDFDTYASEFLMTGLEQQVPGMLVGTLMKQGLSQQEAYAQAIQISKTSITGTPYTLSNFLAGCMAKHYMGDETQDATTKMIISSFLSNADPMYQFLGNVANALATDADTGTANVIADNSAGFTINDLVIPEDTSKTINILHTNDTHGRIFPDPNNKGMIGIDKIAAIHQATANSILVDAGDTIHGLPIVNTTKGKNGVELLSLAGYDVMVPGNHDFNYGSTALKAYANDQATTFDIISANIVNKVDQTPYLPATTIKEVDGIKVGFFGLTTTTTPVVTNPVNVETLEFKEYLASAQAAINELKANGAEVIIGIAHVSRPDVKALASKVKDDVAVIIDAHDHINTTETVDGVLIASAGQYEESIGEITLSLDSRKTVSTKTAKLITKAETAAIQADQAVNARATEMMSSVNKLFSEKVGTSEILLDSSRGTETTKGVRNSEMPLGNIVADAMRIILKTDAAITNGGGLRANIEKGDITKGHLNAVLPFGNYGVVKQVTPSQLKTILENGIKGVPAPQGYFAQVSGMKFEYNPNAAAGSRITKITIGNTVLNLNDTTTKYTLATNDFMANGGDGYNAIKALTTLTEGDSLDAIFENYVKNVLNGKVTAQNAQIEGRSTVVIPSKGSGNNSGGSSGSITPTIVVKDAVTAEAIKKAEKAIRKLSAVDKQATVKKIEEYLPYTLPADKGLTVEQLQKLTNNKFTKEELETMIKKPELLKTLGVDITSLSAATTLKPIENAEFKDVKSSHWASETIKKAAELGLVSGIPDGSFAPSTSLKVADTFTFLDRVLLLNDITDNKLPRSTVEKYITDKDNWAFNNMASVGSKLNEQTLKTISSLGDKPLSRELLAQVLYEVTKGKLETAKEVPAFEDTVNSSYKEAINYCVSVGLLSGTGKTTMSPQKALTRAELMTVLIRIDSLLK